MRIGELAGLVGVSARTVRHYHRRGLLPEPERRANGYRRYGLRDAIELARIRRLTELGLSLDEVRDALADDRGRDLHEILVELDGDLARQEQRIRDRRARLAVLIERAERGAVHADDSVSPEMAELLGKLEQGTGAESALAVRERELFALLDTTAGPVERERVLAAMAPLAADPEFVARGRELARRLEELADAPVDDPRVEPLAAVFADGFPAGVLTGDGFDVDDAFGAAVLDSLAPAQAEVLRRALRLVSERTRDGDGDGR
ncbi:MerR family transcriptional regulator [Amycolatopsis anabasis]|uniref:MerR family transcriptional regulator n=1 Tax=Amycolatopsis anabasis TaxID=1840409 RepID=UPI00131A710B|nr:MerR family transcriptional regulator [Amycolatopsis anabasis]